MMGDHVNPILVKELRQSARSRSLLVMAVLTLLACVLMSLRVLTRQRGMYEPTAGQDLFEMLYFCLSIVGFLVVPTIAHRSLAREQEEGGWELLQLTGLGPRRILLGKLASSLVVGAVFTAVVTPFFLVSFGLGGVQLRVLVRVSAYGAAMTAALPIGTLFAAAVPATRVQRTAMQLITLVGLVLALGGSFKLVEDMVRDPSWHFLDAEANPESPLLWLTAIAAACLVLFEASAARLALPTERYARGPRLAVALLTVVLVALTVQRWLGLRETDDLATHAYLLAIVGAAAALGFAADQDRPRGPGAVEPALLRPGAVWGLRYTAALVTLPAALFFALSLREAGPETAGIVAAPSYVLIYVCAGLWLCRGFGWNRLAAPDVVRGVTVLLTLFCGVLPAAFASAVNALDNIWLVLPSPFLGTDTLRHRLLEAERAHATIVLAVTALVLTVATDRMLVKRARRAAG